MKIPTCLIYFLVSEDVRAKKHRPVSTLVAKNLMPHMMETGIMVKRVPQTELDALIYEPDMTFSSYDEMENERASIWKIMTKEMEVL